ncbi:MAG: hypothetical protein OXF67_09990 [Cyanobacteria bacterium MAG CAR4_bin_6]|nr:hypothetical protein [Cyanobacteria bacterium MAG CAR4_bin_6]
MTLDSAPTSNIQPRLRGERHGHSRSGLHQVAGLSGGGGYDLGERTKHTLTIEDSPMGQPHPHPGYTIPDPRRMESG